MVERRCPRCGECGCGLWWVSTPGRALEASADAQPIVMPVTVLLPEERFSGLATTFLLCGAAAALGIAAWIAKAATTDLSMVLVSLPLSILVGAFCGACLLGNALRSLLPARLELDEFTMQLRLWRSWGGMVAGFRRTVVTLDRQEIVGVAIHTGQAGEAQIFLMHASGLSLGTGWSGSDEAAIALCGPILSWLRPSVGRVNPQARREIGWLRG